MSASIARSHADHHHHHKPSSNVPLHKRRRGQHHDSEEEAKTMTTSMAGDGVYNKGSEAQAASMRQGLPTLDVACRAALGAFLQQHHDHKGGVFRVVDYGCSQGRNSLLPMHTVIRAFVEETPSGSGCSLELSHQDLDSNDFNSLFQTVTQPDAPHTADVPPEFRGRVFFNARGGSFFKPVCPPNQVYVGWCASASHWLSHVPTPSETQDHEQLCSVSDSIATTTAARDDQARRAWAEQSERDWLAFLQARAHEFCVGGQMVQVEVFVGQDEATRHDDFEPMWQFLQTLLREFIPDDAQRRGLAVPLHFRTHEELQKPFRDRAVPFRLLECKAVRVGDPIWDEFQRTGDARTFAEKKFLLCQAALFPSLNLARFIPDLDAFYAKFKRDAAAHPERLRTEIFATVLRYVRVEGN